MTLLREERRQRELRISICTVMLVTMVREQSKVLGPKGKDYQESLLGKEAKMNE